MKLTVYMSLEHKYPDTAFG